MCWIYILKCSDGVKYVGTTKHLFPRFWDHHEINNGEITSSYTPKSIVAIYKVSTLSKFFDYHLTVMNKICNIYCDKLLDEFNDTEDEDKDDSLFAEINITECLMINDKDNWKKIRGAKYTRSDYIYPFSQNEHIKRLPLCKCGLPCDIKKNKKHNYLFFRCAKKNMCSDMVNKLEYCELDVDDEACNYFMKYNMFTYTH